MKRILHLRIVTKSGDHRDLAAFLEGAVPYYESLPGMRVSLLRNLDEPSRYIEVLTYETAEAYSAEEDRMREDPRMQALLQEWRALLAGVAEVEAYEDITGVI